MNRNDRIAAAVVEVDAALGKLPDGVREGVKGLPGAIEQHIDGDLAALRDEASAALSPGSQGSP